MVGAVGALAGAGWNAVSEDEGGGDGIRVSEVYSDDQVQIVSDEKVSAAKAKSLANRIEKAWDFDESRQHWADPTPLQKPLTVAVLSNDAFGKLTGDTTGATAGVTTGPDLFAVPDRVLGRRNAQDENTIAHELGHIQDIRECGERIEDVPIYLQEGKEYLLGECYPLEEKMKNPHITYVGDALKRLTGKDADWLMKHFRHAADEQASGNVGFFGEVTGALFVEFLRVRLNHPDAVAQVAGVISDVGKGKSYDAAFRSHFGLSPKEAEKQFVDFIARTDGNPVARLEGTLFDPERTNLDPRPA